MAERKRDFGAGKPRPERVAAFRTGLSAESRAALMLLAKGFRIAARRWKTPFGEIDIVARRGRTLIFVEVKARASIDDAAFSVTDLQIHRVVAAAHAWLARHPTDGACDIRFDVMLVAPRRLPRHIPAAFDGGF